MSAEAPAPPMNPEEVQSEAAQVARGIVDEEQSFNELAKFRKAHDDAKEAVGPDATNLTGYGALGGTGKFETVSDSEGASITRGFETMTGAGSMSSMTAEAKAEGGQVKVGYRSNTVMSSRMSAPASMTTVVRTDVDGKEVYRHESSNPKMAAKVGELSAKKIKQASN